MEPDFHYRVIESKVAHEIIDGEAIVIHFNSGNYYSLAGVSSRLWQWLATGAGHRQIVDAFQDLKPEQIQSLDTFIDSLVIEELLEKNAGGSAAAPVSPFPKHEIPFEPLKFSKYNDMQNLLLSDPIHDVDETGWPNLETDGV